MSSYKQQILQHLTEAHWEQVEILETDGWWIQECWLMRSTGISWGLELYITFLVDPQCEDGSLVWAVSATTELPESWQAEGAVATLSMSKRKFEPKLEEFLAKVERFRMSAS